MGLRSEGQARVYSRGGVPTNPAATKLNAELERFEKQTLLNQRTVAGRTFREFYERSGEATGADGDILQSLLAEDERHGATQIQRIARGRQSRARFALNKKALVADSKDRRAAAARRKERADAQEQEEAEVELAEIQAFEARAAAAAVEFGSETEFCEVE